MKKRATKLIPLLAVGIVPGAAITTGLTSPTAAAAPGDLDPGFADLGRLGPILNGPVWSIDPEDDDSMLLGGGDVEETLYWSYYYTYASDFVSQLSGTGLIDPNFTAASTLNSQVLDVARQPDGRIVAVGRRFPDYYAGRSQLVVFRLQTDGSFDTTFGDAGVFELSSVDFGNYHAGTSVVLDPDGNIVVAGSMDDSLLVLRLLPDGTPDVLFGTAGVFVGAETFDFSQEQDVGARTNLLRTDDGGYRVTVSNAAGCQVVALTAAGVIDGTFATSGIATVAVASGPSELCNSMVAQADGRLLLAGKANGQGFAARLLADGQPDAGFSANAVSSALSEATAIAVGEDSSVVVAGEAGGNGTVMRLQANGSLDVLFGNAGAMLIDLPSVTRTLPLVRDMYVRADGSIVAAGGDDVSDRAFVIRLLGASGGDSPGVLGITERTVVETAEGDDEIVVNVRRTGGSAGETSLAFQTIGGSATGGSDFTSASGRLTWADGDTAEQQIRVEILANDDVEGSESFQLELSDPQGGAGLGTRGAVVEIAPDGGPYGQLGFVSVSTLGAEGGSAIVSVERRYYSSGSVSVTLNPVAGTATAGSDFSANPVTLTWADGDSGWKSAAFSIVDDIEDEPAESFTIEMSNPTGGALVGKDEKSTVTIVRNDGPRRAVGGGAIGYLSLWLLGVIALFRSARKPSVRQRLRKSGRNSLDF